jgi:hypothetical protein
LQRAAVGPAVKVQIAPPFFGASSSACSLLCDARAMLTSIPHADRRNQFQLRAGRDHIRMRPQFDPRGNGADILADLCQKSGLIARLEIPVGTKGRI